MEYQRAKVRVAEERQTSEHELGGVINTLPAQRFEAVRLPLHVHDHKTDRGYSSTRVLY